MLTNVYTVLDALYGKANIVDLVKKKKKNIYTL